MFEPVRSYTVSKLADLPALSDAREEQERGIEAFDVEFSLGIGLCPFAAICVT